MKASVFTRYGSPEVLEIKEVPNPVVRDNEVLVRVKATSVNFADTLVRNFKAVSPEKFHMPFLFWLIGRISFGLNKPKVNILGSEFSGIVETAGRKVTRFKVGDHVFGYSGPSMGACAQYLRMPEKGIMAIKPANITFEQASAIPYGAVMALGALRKLNLKPGQKVLVNGASGGIGPLLVQLASAHFGAEVTGVCGERRLEYVKSLGAGKVIDYRREDFCQGEETYDYIFDVLGKVPFSNCRGVLVKNGKLLFISFKGKQILHMLWTSMFCTQKAVCVLINEKVEDLVRIGELVEAGKIRAVVDKTFSLEQASEAHVYAESGRKRGNVVITVD